MRAWPEARKEPKEALPDSLFWQSFWDHLCPHARVEHVHQARNTSNLLPIPSAPCAHLASPCRRVMKGQKSGQYNGKTARMHPTISSVVISPSFIPPLHWIFLGIATGFWFACSPRGLEIEKRGGFFISRALICNVGGDMGCKLSHVISQIQDFWEKWGLTQTLLVQKWPEWGRTLTEVAIAK